MFSEINIYSIADWVNKKENWNEAFKKIWSNHC